MSTMNGYQRSHLAGLVDSMNGRLEVSVNRRSNIIPQLVVVTRSLDVLRQLAKFGGSDFEGIEARAAGGRMTWRSRGDEAVELTKAIRPMLWDTAKQEQADLILDLKMSPEGERLVEDNPDIVEEMTRLAPWSSAAKNNAPIDPLLTD